MPLTKTDFAIASTCAAKLYYFKNPDLYANQMVDDDFLLQLAEGGFQVGALAQCYFPEGIVVGHGQSLSQTELVEETMRKLGEGDCVLFEAAFAWNNCFVRADIIEKIGDRLHIIEVKSKSYKKSKDEFTNKNDGEIIMKWLPYLRDIAFQTFVIKNALQESQLALDVNPFLMLVDKDAVCTVDGLNQMFEISRISEKKTVVNRVGNEDLGTEILFKVDVNKEVQQIIELEPIKKWNFQEAVQLFSESVLNSIKLDTDVSAVCKNCEFHVVNGDEGLRDGFRECWAARKGFTARDFEKPMVWKLWNFKKADQCLASGKNFLTDLDRNDLENSPTPANQGVMSMVDRQEHQIVSTRNGRRTPIVLKDDLISEMSQWQFPLHFIDFEGTRTALPFFKGMKPYEQVAFQFSHHLVQENGFIEHKTEWLDVERGSFPNFDFVRALKKALEGNEGTIFMYHSYENTVLNDVRKQLLNSNEADQQELVNFIEHITKRKEGKKPEVVGARSMVDLRRVILDYYYHPIAKNSNSIKKILPAILESNIQLQSLYTQPIYGTPQMPSKNFTKQVWLKYDNDNKPIDPYQLLDPIFDNYSEEGLEEIFELINAQSHLGITNGGAAMEAYAKLQFSNTTPEEREDLKRKLLKYCELDTLAMVIVWQELRDSVA